MLHKQVAINVSTAIQAKGTTKSNAQLNFFSTIGTVNSSVTLIGDTAPRISLLFL